MAAGVILPTAMFIYAWTSFPHVHWIAPILAGVPFGAGNGAVFIYASSYLVHAYDIYAASALAGNAVLRSVMGAMPIIAATALVSSGFTVVFMGGCSPP